MIGGTGRNVGKTEYVCQCISHFSKNHKIIALKVTNHFHIGQDRTYSVFEELDSSTDKDTARMLRSGADKVFYVQSEKQYLHKAFEEFEELISENTLIICESNGLRDIVMPGVFFVVRNSNLLDIKESAVIKLQIADDIVISDGQKFSILPNAIEIDNSRWVYSK